MGEPAVGDFFGTYQLEAEIGLGGAARLFRARHVNPAWGERVFALKVLQAKTAANPGFVSAFRREAFMLSTLEHANIVETFDSGIQGDDLFIAMEYVHGRDFGDVLDEQKGPLPQPLALHVIRTILEALSHAHGLTDKHGMPRGVIHRDIKPSNVLLSYDGRIKLTDFGIAALIHSTPQPKTKQHVLGTMGYFAPEQLDGGVTDHRADIFGVGVVLYEALCGRQPFNAKDTAKLRRQNRRASLTRPRKVNPRIPPELEAVLLRALERKPKRRYASCEQMLADLRPMAPHPAGMNLALGSFIRSLFASSDDIAGGPWQRAPDRQSQLHAAVNIAVCTTDEGDRRRFQVEAQAVPELMLSFFTCTGEVSSHTSDGRALQAIIVDVDDPAFAAADLLAHQVTSPQPAPVLTICNAYETRAVAVSDAVGAVEMLVRPLRENVIRAALARVVGQIRRVTNNKVQQPNEQLEPDRHQPQEERLLLVTHDDSLARRISADFKNWGYHVEVAAGPREALHQIDSACFRSVLFDQQAHEAADTTFAARLRALPGVGLVPILFLRDPRMGESQITLPARTASRPRTTSSVVLAGALSQLRAITHLGRIFRRLPMDGSANLSYGGHSIQCRIVNVSRGGIMVTAGQMPALHTPCRVTVESGTDQPFTLHGRVVRLELDEEAEDTRAGVAVSFGPSPQDAEARLIALVTDIAANRQPLATPPPGMVESP